MNAKQLQEKIEADRKELRRIVESILENRDTDNTYFLSVDIEKALYRANFGKRSDV